MTCAEKKTGQKTFVWNNLIVQWTGKPGGRRQGKIKENRRMFVGTLWKLFWFLMLFCYLFNVNSSKNIPILPKMAWWLGGPSHR